MSDRELQIDASSSKLIRIAEVFRRWWHVQNPNDEYLATASDLAELEHRMRLLERRSSGPALSTFDD